MGKREEVLYGMWFLTLSCRRSFKLQAVDLGYIQLAGPELQDLECAADEGYGPEKWPDSSIFAIASLTALTRLSLAFYQTSSSLSVLQDLQLKELQLVDCPGTAAAILTPRMTSLQKLHIWERMDRLEGAKER